MSTVLAAPFTASLLAELGAEVIKLEHPVFGDPVRNYPPFDGEVSLHHKVTNRGKASVTLDLSSEQGAVLARDLAQTVDIVVTNFRPATLRAWGLDYPDLRKAKESLIVMHLTAFGREGPYCDRPGFARIAEAMSGLTHITGYPDRPPVFAGYPLADGVAGLHGAMSVLAALRHRDLTGEGQLIDLALFEPLLRMMEDLVVGAAENGYDKPRVGNQQANICPNGLFPTSDDEHVILPASTSRMWERLVSLMGASDLRIYASNALRLLHREEIEGRVAAWTAQYQRDELLALLEENGIAAGRVYTATEILADPHLRSRGNFAAVWDEELQRDITVPAPVPTFSALKTTIGRPGRSLGADTDDVLRTALDLSDDQIETLRRSGVVGARVHDNESERTMTNIPDTIHALVSGRRSDPRPVLEEIPRDVLEPDELGLRVLWSSVNYKDALASTPDGKVARKQPLIPGIDLVGEVVDAAGDFAVGDTVVVHGYDLGVAHHGGYATHARVPAAWAFPLPDGLTPREAMLFGTAGFTAALSVTQLEERGLIPGDGPVLVTGATGGVGSASVAMLGKRGYEVIASTGKADARADWLRTVGATDVMGRIEVEDKPRPLSGERWAASVDSVGGQQLGRILAQTQYGGAAAISGLTAGPDYHATVFPHILRGVALLGVDSVQCEMGRRRAVWDRMATDLRPDDLDLLCDKEVTLAEVPDELARILAGEMTGRLVVRVGA